MTGTAISVIIPVYNLQEQIPHCLESVENQTRKDIEIILIDDGSKDRSLEICRDWARRDERIVVYSQENKGVSAARNLGLDKAHGKYIAFIDGDDIVSPAYLECLLREIVAFKAAISICGHVRIRSYDYLFETGCEKGREFIADACAKRVIEGQFPGGVCGALIRRDCIQDLRFPHGIRNNEDKLFLLQLLLNNEKEKVIVSDNRLYGYFVRDGSASRKEWNGNMDSVIVAEEILRIIKQDRPEWEPIAKSACLSARFGILKGIFQSRRTDEQTRLTADCIRDEILGYGYRSCGGTQQKIEYIALKLGLIFYKWLAALYFLVYDDQKRFKRNEKRVKQG